MFGIQREHYKMHFSPTNLSAATWTDPEYRIEDLMILRNILKPGDIFLDLWANIGTISLEAAHLVGPEWIVHAFEPTPDIFWYFQDNIELNDVKNIKAYNMAIGDQNKDVAFACSHADTMNQVSESAWTTVSMKTLDTVIPNQHICLMKVDVEWYEKFVFEWATETLANTDVVYFEAVEKTYNTYGYTTKDVLHVLADNGFEIYGLYDMVIYPVGTQFLSVGNNLLAIKNIEQFLKHTPYTLY